MNLFGKKKQAAPRLNEAIQQMQEALTLLDKREKHLEKQAEQADHDARTKAKQKDKRGTIQLLETVCSSLVLMKLRCFGRQLCGRSDEAYCVYRRCIVPPEEEEDVDDSSRSNIRQEA